MRGVFICMASAALVWFLIPLHWGVANAGNLCGIAFSAAALLAGLLFPHVRRTCAKNRAFRAAARVCAALLCLAVLWAAAMTGLMLAAPAGQPPEGVPVVVLGSKVSGTAPSADLWARIGTAAEYLKAHPKAVCIASGGRGSGEAVSEASVIRAQLAALGVEPGRILTEEQSATTKENFAFSLKLAREKGLGTSFAVVTDDYHEYRACSIARSLGLTPYAVPARTPWYIFSACWAREVLALTKFLIPG